MRYWPLFFGWCNLSLAIPDSPSPSHIQSVSKTTLIHHSTLQRRTPPGTRANSRSQGSHSSTDGIQTQDRNQRPDSNSAGIVSPHTATARARVLSNPVLTPANRATAQTAENERRQQAARQNDGAGPSRRPPSRSRSPAPIPGHSDRDLAPNRNQRSRERSGGDAQNRRWAWPEISGSIRGPAYLEESRGARASSPEYIAPGVRRYIFNRHSREVSLITQTLSERTSRGRTIRGKANILASSGSGITQVSANIGDRGYGRMTSTDSRQGFRERVLSSGGSAGMTGQGASVGSVRLKGDSFVSAKVRANVPSHSGSPGEGVRRFSPDSIASSTPHQSDRESLLDSSSTSATDSDSDSDSSGSYSTQGSSSTSQHSYPPRSPYLASPPQPPQTNRRI